MQPLNRSLRATSIAAVALLLAACGNSGQDAGAQATAGLSGDPIKLMVVSPENVQGAPVSKPQAQAAVKAAAAEFNAAGGIDGRPFEVEWCQEGYDANVATGCARKAIDEGVTAVVGSYVTQPSSFYGILDKANIPVVAPYPLLPQDFTSPNSYLLNGGGQIAYAGVGKRLSNLGVEKAGVIAIDSAVALLSAQYVQAALRAHGIDVYDKVPVIKIGAPDAAAQTSEALEFGAEAIVTVAGFTNVIQVQQAAQQAGAEVRAGGSGVTILPIIDEAPDLVEGAVLAQDFPVVGPDAESYLRTFEEYTDEDFIADDLSIGGYLGVRLIYDLAQDLETVDGPSLRTALGEVSGYSFGPLQDIDFSGDPIFEELPRLRNTHVTVGVIENGEVAWDEEPINPLTDEYVAEVDKIFAAE